MLSLLVAGVVLLYSAMPFFIGSFTALKMRAVTMDVTITIALMMAYGLSAYNQLMQVGETYFESLLMLVFLILLVRFVELKVRQGNIKHVLREQHQSHQKVFFNVLRMAGKYEQIKASQLAVGDQILIKTGDQIPVDGITIQPCKIDESAFTGESSAVLKKIGDAVYQGTFNTGEAFHLKANKVGSKNAIGGSESACE